MVYTLDEIKELIAPVAMKLGIPEVYIFGSYARGDATENSDIDIMIDKQASGFMGLFQTEILYNEFGKALNKPVHIGNIQVLYEKDPIFFVPGFVEKVISEMVKVYG